jgi:enoyl-CoA hydratase
MSNAAFTVDESSAQFSASIRLNRPGSGNRLLTEELQQLGRTIRELGERPTVKAVIVRAEGEQFCMGRQPGPAGAAPKSAPMSAMAIRQGVTEPILGVYADIRATPVPVIALVQGEARGFGCALVGQCDLAIASDSATFSMPEMETNLPPTLAISAVLGKVPPKRLLHLIYTRARISAAEALQIGLVGEVVPRASLDAALDATLSRITDRSRPALCAIKEYMLVAPFIDTAAAARLASSLLSVVLSSPASMGEER